MGALFDSNTFPEQSRSSEETRLTVLLKGVDMSESEARSLALKALAKHLGIASMPEVSMVTRAAQAFPQLVVGHQKWIQDLEQKVEQLYPRLKMVGNYFAGVGVSDCVARARSVAVHFLQASAN